MAARGSSGAPVTRWIQLSSRTTYAASAKARSVAPWFPTSHVKGRLPGQSGQSRGAFWAMASRTVTTHGGLDGKRLALGYHQRHCLADVTNELSRQRRMRREIDVKSGGQAKLGVRLTCPIRVVGDEPQPVGGRIMPGEDGKHARQGSGSRDIDRAYACMGVRRPHQSSVAEPRREEVADVAPAAGDEPAVLASRQCGADAVTAPLSRRPTRSDADASTGIGPRVNRRRIPLPG
jgi:hypothetical protein